MVLRSFWSFGLLLALSSCTTETKQDSPTKEQNQETVQEELDTELISAHSPSSIRQEDPITVLFTKDMYADEAPSAKDIFQMSPAVSGDTRWISNREIHFIPKEPLKQNQKYNVSLNLKKIDSNIKEQNPKFTVQVKGQKFWFSHSELEVLEAGNSVQGVLQTVYPIDNETIKKMVSAQQNGKSLPVAITQENPEKYTFVISEIKREDTDSSIAIEFTGKPIQLDESYTRSVYVPAKNQLTLLSIIPNNDENYIAIRFSDNITSSTKELSRLIKVSGHNNIRFKIKGNTVQVFSNNNRFTGPISVRISAGIKGPEKLKLSKQQNQNVHFGEQHPSVSFGNNGIILPTSENLTVPIEVINLRAVNVQVTQVFDDNLGQFFQVNDLDDSRELKRVGRVVLNKTVSIEQNVDRQNRTVRMGLDLADLISQNPNGLYRIQLSFSKGDISYPCDANLPNPSLGDQPITSDWENSYESSYWDSYYDYDMDYYEYQSAKKNPCSDVFYGASNKSKYSVTRNVMISDIGVIAKKGEDDTLHVTVNDIKNTNPLQGSVKLLDYQLQEIASSPLDADGMATLSFDRKPFAIVAKTADGKDQGWLKLKSNSSLSTSHFDTSGAQNQKGIKGFVYGERGVWRPGDDIYLSFLLHDSEKQLPKNHPVEFHLLDPKGSIIDSRTLKTGKNGLYTLKTGTSYDNLNGNYTARFTVGNSTFRKVLKVENVIPNRLDIKMDFGTELLTDPNITANLASEWLHGGSAAGFTYDVSMKFKSGTTKFDKFSEFSFRNDITSLSHTEEQNLVRNRLGDDGTAAIIATIHPPEESPGMIQAHFTTKVYEPSGAFSIDKFSVPYAPYDAFIGIKTPKGDVARGMLLTDTKHKVDIVAVSPEGKLVDKKVSVKLYKVNWRWWWEKGADNLGDYMARNARSPVAEGEVQLKNGKGSWDFEVKYPSWGRYLLIAKDLNGGHISTKTVYIDWPGWAGRAQSENPGGASVLSVTTEKPKYNIGEDITVNIPSGKSGRILVSLENGTKVLRQEWVTPKEGTTKYTFKATSAMAPNIYAHVTLLQPHNSSDNDLPIRLYGITPIEVVDPNTQLSPQIATADTFEPESKATVEISESSNKPMTYTLAVVDEGLLQLTRYKTPNPWGEFYKKESLGVRSWDNYTDIAGAYGMALEGMISIGGDGSGESNDGQEANRFPPMVDFQGPFTLAAGEKQKREIDIGAYIGKVRVMVVAGQDGAFGSYETSVQVKKPLMVLGTLPRILRPEEELSLPVSIFALDDSIKTGDVTVSVDGPLTLASDATQKLKFDTNDKLVNFKLKVKNQIGIAKVKIKAKSGKHIAEQVIEIGVQPAASEVYSLVGADSVLEKGTSWSQKFAPIGMAGTNFASLEVSRIPPMELEKHLNKLIRYPHGCIEQTTSSVFPQLYLSSLIDLSKEKADRVQKNINAGIDRLRSFQLTNGGFAYWPGANSANSWGSNYAGHFLLEAEKAGFFVPPGMRSSWIQYQIAQSNVWNNLGRRAFDEQAYRLYTLALAGVPQISTMNRLKSKKLTSNAKWRLALAYQLAGQNAVAKELTNGLETDIPDYQDLSGNFGSTLRDKAMILEAMVGINHEKTADFVVEVAKGISEAKYPSTQTMAYSLIALAKSAQLDGDKPFDFTWTINGKTQKASSNKPIYSTPFDLADTNNIKISDAPFSLYPRIVLSGVPAIGQEKTENNDLELVVDYFSTTFIEEEGRTRLQYTPISPSTIKQGTDFVARIKVTNTSGQKLEELALTERIPSGWEFHSESSGTGVEYEYRNVADARVDTYFDLEKGKSKTFEVNLHATYQGKFYLPLVSVEAMYDPTIFAREKGMWIQVLGQNDEG